MDLYQNVLPQRDDGYFWSFCDDYVGFNISLDWKWVLWLWVKGRGNIGRKVRLGAESLMAWHKPVCPCRLNVYANLTRSSYKIIWCDQSELCPCVHILLWQPELIIRKFYIEKAPFFNERIILSRSFYMIYITILKYQVLLYSGYLLNEQLLNVYFPLTLFLVS